MAQAAEQLPQEELFAHLLGIGKAQRAATDRLHGVQASLSPSGVNRRNASG